MWPIWKKNISTFPENRGGGVNPELKNFNFFFLKASLILIMDIILIKHRKVGRTCFQARSGGMSRHVELTFVTDAARPLDIAGSPKPLARLPGPGPGQPSGRGCPEPGTSRALVNRYSFL